MAEHAATQPHDPTVLPDRMGGGPHGLGDPEDRSLRRVEVDVLIPKLMRDRAREEKCAELVEAFSQCSRDSGLAMVYKCRPQNNAMKDCLTHWYQDAEFKKECTAVYLADRSEYRATGIKSRLRQKRLG